MRPLRLCRDVSGLFRGIHLSQENADADLPSVRIVEGGARRLPELRLGAYPLLRRGNGTDRKHLAGLLQRSTDRQDGFGQHDAPEPLRKGAVAVPARGARHSDRDPDDRQGTALPERDARRNRERGHGAFHARLPGGGAFVPASDAGGGARRTRRGQGRGACPDLHAVQSAADVCRRPRLRGILPRGDRNPRRAEVSAVRAHDDRSFPRGGSGGDPADRSGTYGKSQTAARPGDNCLRTGARTD